MQRPRARPQVLLRGIFLRYERARLPSSRLQALVMFRRPSSVAYLLAVTSPIKYCNEESDAHRHEQQPV